MTTFSEAREAIYKEFLAAWPGTTPLTFDNEKFTPPAESEWARLSVRHLTATQETLGSVGNRKFARFGLVFVQIFCPLNQGLTASDVLVIIAQSVFEGERITGTTIRFLDVNVQEQGRDNDSFSIVVEANFEYDETK